MVKAEAEVGREQVQFKFHFKWICFAPSKDWLCKEWNLIFNTKSFCRQVDEALNFCAPILNLLKGKESRTDHFCNNHLGNVGDDDLYKYFY